MTLPSLHLTMRTIVYAVVPVLGAAERAVEKSCCIAAVLGNTSETLPHAPIALQYSNTTQYNTYSLYSSAALYNIQRSTPSL